MKTAVGSAQIVAAVTVAATVAGGAQVAAECLRLINSTAGISSAIMFVADKDSDIANLPLYELLAPLDKELPWLSTCVSSADVLSVGLGLLSDPMASQCVSLLTGGSTNNLSLASLGEDDFSASLCPSMHTTIFPCVNELFVGAIEHLMTTGSDCCAEMKKKLPELLGQELEAYVQALMVRVGDLICSVKTYVDPLDGRTKNVTCGQALVNSVLTGQDLFDLVKLLQIPNDQACSAMIGQNFTVTSGAPYRLFANQVPLDSCFAPANNLLTDLAKVPMVAQSWGSLMFDADKCLKGDSIISMALDEKGIIQSFVRALDTIIADMQLMPLGAVTKVLHDGFSDVTPDFGSLCFHLPNSASDCD